MYVASVGRVRYSDPFWDRMPMSNGVTFPEAFPKLTISPSGFRQSSEARKVSLPTESYTTGTPAPPVISRTRLAMSSRVETMTWSQPVSPGDRRLLVRPDGADDRRPEGLQPLAGDQPDPAGRGVEQDRLARP